VLNVDINLLLCLEVGGVVNSFNVSGKIFSVNAVDKAAQQP